MSDVYRQSVLDVRHAALGATFEGDTWNGMRLPWSYARPLVDEVVATRQRATLIDVTAVNLVRVTGSDAEAVLDRLVTIDVTRLRPGQGRIGAEVDDRAAIIDDILLIRLGAEEFLLSHGSGATRRQLEALAAGRAVHVASDLDTHCMSLQGPIAAQVLDPHCEADLASMKYFEFTHTRLFGRDVLVSRSGYAGEYGFEVYCAAKDALYLWDTILLVGDAHGVIPCSWFCLEATRVEACLLFFPFEMCEGDTTPWELNQDWAVDLDKPGDYVGKAALLAARGKERFRQGGVVCHSKSAVEAGAKLLIDGREVGVVTSAFYSEYLMQSLAMVHLAPEAQALGTKVEILGKGGGCTGVVSQTPFYDPMRLRTYPERR